MILFLSAGNCSKPHHQLYVNKEVYSQTIESFGYAPAGSIKFLLSLNISINATLSAPIDLLLVDEAFKLQKGYCESISRS